MTHGHVHSNESLDDWGGPELPSVRRLLSCLAIGAFLVALCGVVAWWPSGDSEVDRETLGFGHRVNATVTAAVDGPCSYDPETVCRVVDLQIDPNDDSDGATAQLETDIATATPAAGLEVGDEVVLNDAGTDVPPDARYSFADVRRGRSLAVLAIIFALAVVALGRLRGLLALTGIGVTFAVLLWYLFPALLHGSPPLGVALSGATIIAFGTLYLAHGFNVRTTVALLGTLASLALTAFLAVAFAGAAELSGLANEDSLALLTAAPDLDFRGLLLAAVIIGALGVLDDVTVTQVAAVGELHRSNPATSRRELFLAGNRIGRDHIASTVNTLVLAYSAAALPLLLIYSQSGLGLGNVLTSEVVAVEIVQTLVGSIGLVSSVPLTTALAAWVVSRAGAEADEDGPIDGTDPDTRHRAEPELWFPPSMGGRPAAWQDQAAWPPPAQTPPPGARSPSEPPWPAPTTSPPRRRPPGQR